ncbi:hypothetical protein GGR90_003339 [Sphingopyxis italica]|uniref:Uncharacterized protein n=1 Tax=Sphingopyxis italica TaxID=1129133 RepID=A0A7X5XTP3_9SPHN|nr:hypothetical protein [Sphingopyxis italica]NJB91137.1 hypothetical protein [Sphingopyxis italica]
MYLTTAQSSLLVAGIYLGFCLLELFFWDILFGTAKITRRFPQSYGVENLPPATLGQQLLWPIFPENRDMDAHIAGAAPATSKAVPLT